MKKHVWVIAGTVVAAALAIFLIGKFNFQGSRPAASRPVVGTQAAPPQVDQKPVPTKDPASSAETPKTTATPKASQSGSTSVDSGPLKEPHPADEGQGSVRGTVVDASSSTLIVKTESGDKQYSFLYQSAEVTGTIYVDAKVEVFYSGKLEDNNSMDVYVTRVVVYPS